MLSDNSKFGVRPLTEAINRVPAAPTQIRDLALFEARYLNTTYVDVENQSGELRVVQSQPRGNPGNNVPPKHRESRTFKIPHLPVDDVVRADDVQNIRAFGSTQAETVQKKVDEKLADGKAMLEITREHLMLGALQGYHWALVAVPGVAWLLTAVGAMVAMKASVRDDVQDVKDELEADFAVLRTVKEARRG